MASKLLPKSGPRRHLLDNIFKTRATTRCVAMAAAQKKEGDISDAFASLSGMQFEPLEPRFADVKARLIAGHEDAVRDSWNRLLASLKEEIPIITDQGSKVIPQIDFKDIDNASPEFRAEHKKRGVAVIRNVVPREEALAMKEELRGYLKANPQTKLALGRLVDGGSCVRWEEGGYGRGKVYDAIWKGKWEEYDPWESSTRLPVVSDMYGGVGACSMFRMFQGWLSSTLRTLIAFGSRLLTVLLR